MVLWREEQKIGYCEYIEYNEPARIGRTLRRGIGLYYINIKKFSKLQKSI